MTANLQNPIFNDLDAAREALEAVRWPLGPYCPHCGNADPERIAKVAGKKQSHRPGLYYCNECKGQFTVTVGTVFERSKVPLTKWWLATFLMNSSKKGFSAHQLHRSLGVTYKTAWFMAHRVRAAMAEMNPGPMGGKGKIIEADETYYGNVAGTKRARRRDKGASGQEKWKVVSLVERGGKARSTHVDYLTATTLRNVLVTNADRKSDLMTDEFASYIAVGKEYASHQTVVHSKEEYVRGNVHTNSIEGFFSIFKRGMMGIYQHCSEQHLCRYLSEFDFRYSHRVKLGYSDWDRTLIALRGIEDKRLTYRRPDQTARA